MDAGHSPECEKVFLHSEASMIMMNGDKLLRRAPSDVYTRAIPKVSGLDVLDNNIFYKL